MLPCRQWKEAGASRGRCRAHKLYANAGNEVPMQCSVTLETGHYTPAATVSSQRLSGEISDLGPVLFKEIERLREYSGLSVKCSISS